MDVLRGEAGGLAYLEVVPDTAPRDLPLVVGLHGRGAAAEDLGGVVMHLDDQHYRYILFYAPLVLDLGDGLRYAWFERERQDETLPPARAQLTAALRTLGERYGAPPAKTALFGF